MKKLWLEIYYDAEGRLCVLRDIEKIGENKWRLVLWELDDDLDPIIESSKILYENGTLKECQNIANQHAKKLREKDYKIYISNRNPNSKFTLRSIEWELIGYEGSSGLKI